MITQSDSPKGNSTPFDTCRRRELSQPIFCLRDRRARTFAQANMRVFTSIFLLQDLIIRVRTICEALVL